jgi:predicted MFS family arabinose efflux permease
LIYIQLGLWGYFNYGFGPIVPLLRDEQGTSNALAGLHSTAIAAGAMIGGALFPIASRRFGRGTVLWGALAGMAAAVLGYVLLPALYPVTLALTAGIAVCGIALVCAVVSVLSQVHGPAGPAAISEANAVACAAGLVAPLVIGATVRAGFGWRPGLAVLLLLILIVAVVAMVKGVRIPADAPVLDIGLAAATRLPRAYWLAWTMMTVTGAIEVVLSMWAASVLRDQVHLSAGAATATTSAIVGGMFLGRLFGARFALRLPSIPLYFGALAVSALGFAIFWTADSAVAAVAGLVVLGLGNAMHYPLAISLAIAAAPGQADRAAGVASYSMAIGFGLGPLLLGLVADQVGAHLAFLLIPLLIVAAALLAWRFAASPRELAHQPA